MAASSVVETLRALQSNDNVIRDAAEKHFSDAVSQQPAVMVEALLQALAERQLEETVRVQAAVLLRGQCLSQLTEEGSVWAKIGAEAQTAVRAKLMQLLAAEPQKVVRTKVADSIQHVANQIAEPIGDGERPQNLRTWPELLPAMLQITMDGAQDAGLRADALWVVKECLESVWPIMLANAAQTAQVLGACLADPSDAVRCIAARTLCVLVDNIEEREERQLFVPLLQPFGEVLTQLAKIAEADAGRDDKDLCEVLQDFQATKNSADFFKEALAGQLLPLLCAMAKSLKQENARKSAIEVLVTFADERPKAMLKIQGFVEQTVGVALQLISELNDDVEGWAAKEDDEDDGEDEDEPLVSVGKSALDRLAGSMDKAEKFPVVLEALKPLLAQLLAGGHWKQIVTGLAALSQIIEYVDEQAAVEEMLGAVRAHLGASHVRVRHQAWRTLCQFVVDHHEYACSDALAQAMLQNFMANFEDPCVRVLEAGMSAFEFYGQHVERELLEPFMQPLMGHLGQKLQSPKVSIQKKAITSIAVMAQQMQRGFAVYYSSLMPVLKQMIERLLHNVEEREFLGKVFECISHLAKAVGPQGFKSDAEGIMQAMIQAMSMPNLPKNDPVKEYAMNASELLCGVLKADFVPFVPHLLPAILEKFKIKPQDARQHEIDDEEEVMLVIQKGEDGKPKAMVMSSAALEELNHAVECVHTFSHELGRHYAPYVSQTAQAVLQLFDFHWDDDVRNLAFETWGELCKCARAAEQPQILTGLVQELLKRSIPVLERDAVAEEVNAEQLKTLADGVRACLQEAGTGILGATEVQHITQVALNSIAGSFKRRERAAAQKRPKTGAEDEEEDEDPDADERAARLACNDILGALMKTHPDLFFPEALQKCLPSVLQLLQPSVPEKDRLLSVYFICSMLEHLGVRVTELWPQFMPQVLADVMHKSAETRQAACYAVSLAAKNPALAQVAQETSQKAAQIITDARSRAKKKSDKDAQSCADNALSALVQILLHHSPALGGAEGQLWSVWLSGLPCQEDEQEAERNHSLLLEFAMAEKAEVVGSGGANLGQVMAVLVDVYEHDDLSTEEINKGIEHLVRKLAAAGALEPVAAKLSEKQAKKLHRIHLEAQDSAGA